MKNPIEVLRVKEQEISRIKKEIDALRVAAQLLNDEGQPPKSQPPGLRKGMEVH